MSNELKYLLNLENGGWMGAVAKSKQALANFTSQVKSGDLQGAAKGVFTAMTEQAKQLVATAARFPLVTAGIIGITAAVSLLKSGFTAAIEAAKFEGAVLRLSMLTGSIRSARQAMLELTEGSNSIDAFFDVRDIEGAYRALHNLTGGVAANAAMIRLLGDVAARTGETSLTSLAERYGFLFQVIKSGGAELGRTLRQFVMTGAITQEAANRLAAMNESGENAGEVMKQLTIELAKARGSLDALAQGAEGASKRLADAKGTLAREWGELFLPALEGWRSFQSEVIEGTARLINAVRRINMQRLIFGNNDQPFLLPENNDGPDLDLDAIAAAASGGREADASALDSARKAYLDAQDKLDAVLDQQALAAANDTQRRTMIQNRLNDILDKYADTFDATAALELRAQAAQMAGELLALDKRIAEAKELELKTAAERIAAARAGAEALRRQSLSPADQVRALRGDAAEATHRATLLGLESQRDPENRTLAADFAEAQLDAARKTKAAADALEALRSEATATASAEREARAATASARRDAAARAGEQLERLDGTRRSTIDVIEATRFLRDVRSGRTPDEDMARDIKDMAKLLKEIRDQGGLA